MARRNILRDYLIALAEGYRKVGFTRRDAIEEFRPWLIGALQERDILLSRAGVTDEEKATVLPATFSGNWKGMGSVKGIANLLTKLVKEGVLTRQYIYRTIDRPQIDRKYTRGDVTALVPMPAAEQPVGEYLYFPNFPPAPAPESEQE